MEKEQLVKSLVKDGFLVVNYHQSGELAGDDEVVLEVGNGFDNTAKKLVKKYGLKGYNLWFPRQNDCVDYETGLCNDGGYAPDECDLYL